MEGFPCNHILILLSAIESHPSIVRRLFVSFSICQDAKVDPSFVKNLEVHITSDTEDFLDLYPYKSTCCIDD